MTKLDILYLFFLIPPIILGIRQGIVGITISLITMVTLYIVYIQSLGELRNSTFFNSDSWIKVIIPIVLISSVALFIGHYLRKFIEKILSIVFLNWVNKSIGGCIGLIAGTIICVVVCHFGKIFPTSSPFINSQSIANSTIHPIINSIANIIGW